MKYYVVKITYSSEVAKKLLTETAYRLVFLTTGNTDWDNVEIIYKDGSETLDNKLEFTVPSPEWYTFPKDLLDLEKHFTKKKDGRK